MSAAEPGSRYGCRKSPGRWRPFPNRQREHTPDGKRTCGPIPTTVDPYDVAKPGVTATKTPFERDDASVVNPQHRRRERPS